MFGIGMGEMVLIAAAAVLILGPERCISFAQKAGKLLREIRSEWTHTKQGLHNLDNEFKADEPPKK